jgi:hypothetical protein
LKEAKALLTLGLHDGAYYLAGYAVECAGSRRKTAWSDAMDKTVLVSIDLEKGSELLQVLDRAGVRVQVALWAHLAEYQDWRLILSTRKFDSLGIREGYRLLYESLASGGFADANTLAIMILPMADPFIKGLRAIFGKAKSVDGMRLGGQLIGDRFVEEAYVYRIS